MNGGVPRSMYMHVSPGSVPSSSAVSSSRPFLPWFIVRLPFVPLVWLVVLVSMVALPSLADIHLVVVSSFPPRKRVESQFPARVSHCFSYKAFSCARFCMIMLADIPLERMVAMRVSNEGIFPMFANSSRKQCSSRPSLCSGLESAFRIIVLKRHW